MPSPCHPKNSTMPSLAFTTAVKQRINSLLRVVGLELNTTTLARIEAARLYRVVANGHWERPRYDVGLEKDLSRFLDFLQTVCLPYRDDFTALPRTAAEAGEGFYLENGYFQAVDAEVMYCILRYYAPANCLEIGSGHSTRLIRRAIEDGRLATQLISIDPDPRVPVSQFAARHVPRPVEELEVSEVAGWISPGDIVFIDSSHLIKSGGDLPYLYLELLPRLLSGTFIHIHDIFLPFDYPRQWVVEFGWGWTEQYLVNALLAGGERYEVLWPAYFMCQLHRDEVAKVIPSAASATPASLWLRIR
jgi:hypothetical protein